ncbi:isopentenyl-diphosphate Delta-isomerase [Raoultella ornithinolytica]|uniref:isopentenyl-diphosphate Delta-isomerase n=1 Tax=Raoultella ornithinolytica TaxID=54291 RepID=UPI000BE26C97|nr:isopentenyl-diphosphate Delta-isomerase [Raoultella ornithinolytica]PJF12557.1 isopentenyl-diphosphate Delta-isomerase [Raoultella ornithinolytica]PJO28786.1 isopentenyl-diphosphate Delta-isomerase [Raoultella ornithinolytica]
MTGEHVILLDEQDKPVGRLEKYAAHTLNTPLHLAFSCWLFNDRGQLLVTRRSLGKKAWPGVWTNSVCGHPQSGETFEQAVTRRSRFELGVNIANIASVHPAFRYRAVAPNGIVENEVCPVYAARIISPVLANSDEVMDYQWCELEDLLQALALTPWAYSPWIVLEAADDNARQALRNYVAQLRY